MSKLTDFGKTSSLNASSQQPMQNEMTFFIFTNESFFKEVDEQPLKTQTLDEKHYQKFEIDYPC